MARCSCGNATCSCVVKPVPNSGVTVSGSGSPTRPYLIGLQNAGQLNTVIEPVDTPTINMEMSGVGTTADKLQIYAHSLTRLVDLKDVADPEGPQVGDVPLWVAPGHWEFKPPPTTPVGAITVSNGIGGDGSGGNPLRARNSGVFGSVSSPPALSLSGTDSLTGQPIYVDTSGNLRAQPQILPIPKLVTALVNTYPAGTTVMSVDAASGANWPALAACTVVTHRSSPDGIGSQWCYLSSQTVSLAWMRVGNVTAWGPWATVGAPALPNPATTYQSTDVPAGTSRHVEGSPSTRVSIINPHPTRKLLVQTSISCWMGIGSFSAVGDAYIDIDCLSGGSEAVPIGSTVAEVRNSIVANGTNSANFSNEWLVNANSTAIWYASAAKVGGTYTFNMRGTRLRALPIRYV